MLRRIAGLPRYAKSIIMVLADFFLLPLCLWLAVCMHAGSWGFDTGIVSELVMLSVVSLPVFIKSGLYRAVIRYLDERAVATAIRAVSFALIVYAVLARLLDFHFFTLAAFPIFWCLCVSYVCASRYMVRALLRSAVNPRNHRRKILIYGAGDAGRQLAVALRAGTEFDPVAFMDDDKSKQGLSIVGIKVYPSKDISAVVKLTGATRVLLAMPSAPYAQRLNIIDRLEHLRVEVRAIPGVADLVNGEISLADVREVSVDELLAREAVPPDVALLQADIHERVVMVTGAGGSIGSELCRQILAQGPKCLVLYEICEFALYSIDAELKRSIRDLDLSVEVVSVLGSVQIQDRVERIMRRYGVNTVYHAAAYKHVPIVEFNITEGILNNTFGTLSTARAAVAAGVATFVLISTDKAVRPTNVMGASKRMAELVLQAMTADPKVRTRFAMVRFGNVLGSSGSVVPLFRRQIAEGGPVTVTHAEITRYFMTIPEAAQLVIQAGAMGKSGEVFVLDMGEPVRIIDLARRMIHLSGFDVLPTKSGMRAGIDIVFTGLRPGEKLYEELLIGDDVIGTEHPKIMKAQERFIEWLELEKALETLRVACSLHDQKTIFEVLKDCVSGFQPSGEMNDYLCAGCDPVPSSVIMMDALRTRPTIVATAAAARGSA
ncbi:polysaccharide biosynthesis protein [Chitinimonas arctica]|uniref:Polysaccharide biosynthesis protein n=1 Tax=Chitinimonas arctica TaxID=2594795 RepID=A0A516SC47_9NEIS|nr:nucleoside-diphosphate sugar epimerase/dehydratase [Chitinimonas arctica]QDQ25714.1 polysaccharide biosynthesis protein [Chitinimonas arctica]